MDVVSFPEHASSCYLFFEPLHAFVKWALLTEFVARYQLHPCMLLDGIITSSSFDRLPKGVRVRAYVRKSAHPHTVHVRTYCRCQLV